jgi:hypothetical protein
MEMVEVRMLLEESLPTLLPGDPRLDHCPSEYDDRGDDRHHGEHENFS